MKNLIKVLFVQCFFIGIAISGYGQCVPDTANCKDIDKPGQICPDTLPAAVLNTWYEQVITIISQTKLLPVKPNPFNIRSRIGILADQFGVGELYVYYITGQLVHHEEKWIQPGKNYFDYNGEELTKGIYLYRVSFMGKSFTSRVVKM